MAVYNLDNLNELIEATMELDGVDSEKLRDLLDAQHPADVADILERLDDEERFQVFQLLDDELAAEVLDELGTYATRQIIEQLPDIRIANLMARMPMDDVTELLTDDVPERREAILALMPLEQAAEIVGMLDFPPDSTGRLMTRRFAKVNPEMTGDQVLGYLRRIDSKVETITDMYVLDKEGKLEGVISLREVINMKPHQRVKEIMVTDVVSVPPNMEEEKAARMFGRYDLLTMPVVTPEGRMLGIITVDDAMDVLTQENTEDILKFGGVTGDVNDQPYFTVPILRVIRHRFVWLLLLFLADTLTGNVLRIFETELAAVVALSFYIPLLIGTGGNTGAQTVSTIIRSLAIGDVQFRDAFRVIRREMLSGLILGGTLGFVAALRAYLWDGNVSLAIVVGVTVVTVCAWANTIGSLIPLIAKRIGIDPAVVSAPMITTLVDASGLFIYLSIAKLILGL